MRCVEGGVSRRSDLNDSNKLYHPTRSHHWKTKKDKGMKNHLEFSFGLFISLQLDPYGLCDFLSSFDFPPLTSGRIIPSTARF